MAEGRCPQCNQPYAEVEFVTVGECVLFRTADGQYRSESTALRDDLEPHRGQVCLTCAPPISSQEAHWWQDRLGRRLT